MGAEVDTFVEQVRTRSDIYSVVSDYVSLKFRNGQYWACCPFHGGNEESFTIAPDKGFFYCFHCHAGGDALKFISMKENISYVEAVKRQAEKFGISLPLRKKNSDTSKPEQRKKILFKINQLAGNFYHKFLTKSDAANECRKYLAARGITGDTIEEFNLGFAPKNSDELAKFFFKRNIPFEQSADSGLILRQDSDEKFVDGMQECLVIPMTDVFGRVVGIGGRILKSVAEKDSAKFFDIPKTIIFDESSFVFGLSKPVDSLVIVKNFTEVIFFKNAGIENVAATFNVPFNEEHLRFLLKYAKKIIFCCGNGEIKHDELPKIFSITKNFENKIRFVSMPEEKTLQNFVRENGKEKFDELVKNALPAFDYRLQCILNQNVHSSPEEKIETLKKIFQMVSAEKNAEISDEHLKKISAALESDENKILEEWRKFHAPPPSEKKDAETLTPKKPAQPKKQSKEDVWFNQAFRKILRICWLEDDLLSFVAAMLPEESFSEAQREILGYIKKSSNEGQRPNISNAKNFLSERAYIEISKILANLPGDDPRDEDIREFDDSVHIARKIFLQRTLERKNQESKKYLNENDLISYEKIFLEINDIKKELNSLK